MPIDRVPTQDTTGLATAANVSATYPAVPTPGNTLLAFLYYNQSEDAGSMPAGWRLVEFSTVNGANGYMACFTKPVPLTGTEPQTVTYTDTFSAARRLALLEYTGVATVSPDDGNESVTTGATAVLALQTAALTTANPDDLLVAAWAFNGASVGPYSVDQGYSIVTNVNRLTTAEKIVSATGTYAPTLTQTASQRQSSIHIALKAAAAAPPPSASGSFLSFF